jgi:hypothetical protein
VRPLRSIPWLGFVALAGCVPEVPGEPIGTFDIVMSLEENGCGEGAVIVTDGARFAAELRSDATRAYWRVPEQPLIDGREDDGAYMFVTRALVDTSDPDAGPVCQLVQTAELIAKVHAGSAGAGAGADAGDAGQAEAETEGLVLDATYTLTLEAAAGTDCSIAISPRGVFKTLPCTVEYSFAGTEREPLGD